jgi:hypothetical protein
MIIRGVSQIFSPRKENDLPFIAGHHTSWTPRANNLF